MIELASNDLAVIRRLLEEHAPDCEVRAFGSRVTGGARSYSDLDLVLIGAGRLGVERLFAVKEAFQASELPMRVDVIDWHGTTPAFREAIGDRFEIIQPARS